jgi:[acyl-carrier-protein] S-malonyltransferase
MLAVCAPGQGSQFSGMLKHWTSDSADKAMLKNFSNLLELDLEEIGYKYSDVDIRKTDLAQVLIVVNSIISFNALGDHLKTRNKILYAGHSVGEIPAGFFSGVYSIESALKLVRKRGASMAKAASESSETGMSAILGGSRDEVVRHLSQFKLSAANINSDGQIVAAGKLSDLAKLQENPLTGTRVRPLEVAAAFHTDYMKSARIVLENFAKTMEIFEPKQDVLSNFDGQKVSSGKDFVNKLVQQITSPVRWDLCQESFVSTGVTGMLELAPGNTLCGIAKRQIPNIETFALKSPDDLPEAIKFIDKHSG